MTPCDTEPQTLSAPAPRVTVPETHKKTGVFYITTDEGWELPLIDILHPAFDDIPDPAALEQLVANHMERQAKFARIPRLFRRIMMWRISRHSIMMRALRDMRGSFLPGIATYIMKLGAANLGQGYSGKVDQMIAASAPAASMRIRLRNMARLGAEGLLPLLEAAPGRPLTILNIAGGPAMDNLNMLRLLRHEHPAVLEGRPVRIHVLDRDAAGPAFGARALAAWTRPVGPLAGLQVTLEHHPYDWSAPRSLEPLSAPWGLEESVALACSEGGLFEYGSDETITGNLVELGRLLPAAAVVVGSVTRDCPLMRTMVISTNGKHPTTPRTLEAFTALARGAGWGMEQVLENVISLDVRMTRLPQ